MFKVCLLVMIYVGFANLRASEAKTLKCYYCNSLQMCSMEAGKEQHCGLLSRHCIQNIAKGGVNLRDCAPDEDPYGPPEGQELHNNCRHHRGFEVCFCKGELCNEQLPPCAIRLNKTDGACRSERENQYEPRQRIHDESHNRYNDDSQKRYNEDSQKRYNYESRRRYKENSQEINNDETRKRYHEEIQN